MVGDNSGRARARETRRRGLMSRAAAAAAAASAGARPAAGAGGEVARAVVTPVDWRRSSGQQQQQ